MNEEIKKPCSKCGIPKLLSEFPKRADVKDGRGAKCKQCEGLAKKKYYQKNKKTIQVKRKHRYQANREDVVNYNKNHLEERRHATQRYRSRNPEKDAARVAVSVAVKLKRLPRVKTLQCVYCGEQAQQYHHHRGYDKEHRLDVVPACIKCHSLIDSF